MDVMRNIDWNMFVYQCCIASLLSRSHGDPQRGPGDRQPRSAGPKGSVCGIDIIPHFRCDCSMQMEGRE